MQITPTKVLDLDDLLVALAAAIAAAGSQAAWCAENNISTAYVSDALNRRRAPGKKILTALGYEAVTYYRTIEPSRREAPPQ